MASGFDRGEYDALARRVDLLVGNANTVPYDFVRVAWHRKEFLQKRRHRRGAVLVLLDEEGFGARLAAELRRQGIICVTVASGEPGRVSDGSALQMRVHESGDRRWLARWLEQAQLEVHTVVDLRLVGATRESIVASGAYRRLLGILELRQEIESRGRSERPAQVLIVSAPCDPVADAAGIGFPELLWSTGIDVSDFRWVHLDACISSNQWTPEAAVAAEVTSSSADRVISYRRAGRWAARLQYANGSAEVERTRFPKHRTFVVEGSLEGAGLQLIEALLDRAQAHVLVIRDVGLLPTELGNTQLETLRRLQQRQHCTVLEMCDDNVEALRQKLLDVLGTMPAVQRWIQLANPRSVRANSTLNEVIGVLNRQAAISVALATIQPEGPWVFASTVDTRVFRVLKADEPLEVMNSKIFVSVVDSAPCATLSRLVLEDQYGLPTRCDFVFMTEPEKVAALERCAIAHLPEFPLLPSRIPDRDRLMRMAMSEGGYVAPRTAVEQVIADLWADVLVLPRVSIEDDFFSLGGHSLLATQVGARLRDMFDTEVPFNLLFQAPTVTKLANRLLALEGDPSRIERKAMRALQRVDRPEVVGGVGLGRALSGSPMVSLAQERQWFLAQLAPDSPVYNVPAALEITGQLSTDALEQAFNEIVDRHEALRSSIRWEGKKLAVFISTRGETKTFEHVDLRNLNSSEVAAEVFRYVQRDAGMPFDLARPPLVRATLLQRGDCAHTLIVTFHHVVADWWSVEIFVKELATLYDAILERRTAPLTELPLQYPEFAARQRDQAEADAFKSELSYWMHELRVPLPVLEVPRDYPRPPVQSYRGETIQRRLSKDLANSVRQLARQEGVTRFVVMLTAFEILLHRYSSQSDLLIGSPVACRNRTELEPMIGLFMNMIVFRVDVSEELSVRGLLTLTREKGLQGIAHSALPFEHLLEALNVPRKLGHPPVFQVAFGFQEALTTRVTPQGLSIRPCVVYNETSKLDLYLTVEEAGQEYDLALTYDSALFDRATVEQMLFHYERVLDGMAYRPHARVSEIELLDVMERTKLVSEWNATERPVRQNSVVSHVEATARVSGQSPAVQFGKTRLSYAELNARANLLARQLRNFGVRRGVSVGICMERAAELPVALLAVLKAGAAYVPLDPMFPAQRLRFIWKDLRAEILLTNLQERSGFVPADVACLRVYEGGYLLPDRARPMSWSDAGGE